LNKTHFAAMASGSLEHEHAYACNLERIIDDQEHDDEHGAEP